MAKKPTVKDVKLNSKNPKYELLFTQEASLSAFGNRVLKGTPGYARKAFCIAFQCGYDYLYLKKLLKCKSEAECERILVTARHHSVGFGRTAFVE